MGGRGDKIAGGIYNLYVSRIIIGEMK